MRTLKFFAFTVTLSFFFAVTLPLYPLLFLFPFWTRRLLVRIVSFSARMMLWILNIKVDHRGTKKLGTFLIVSNHLSYIDILVLASIYPSCFVTSKEIKATPFLGQIVTLAGCLFVDRKNKSSLRNEILELREALSHGLNVTVFPEATSTNGDEVLRFKRPLFESALATGRPILPLTINYTSLSGSPVCLKNRDSICWYGDMSFFPHFLKLLKEKTITAKVVIADPVIPEFMSTLDLAMKTHQSVSKSFTPLNRAMEAI